MSLPESHMMFGTERPERKSCSECGRSLDGLMAVHEDRPGLIGSLRGEGGEAWRVFVTVATCLLVVLLITGFAAIVGHAG